MAAIQVTNDVSANKGTVVNQQYELTDTNIGQSSRDLRNGLEKLAVAAIAQVFLVVRHGTGTQNPTEMMTNSEGQRDSIELSRERKPFTNLVNRVELALRAAFDNNGDTAAYLETTLRMDGSEGLKDLKMIRTAVATALAQAQAIQENNQDTDSTADSKAQADAVLSRLETLYQANSTFSKFEKLVLREQLTEIFRLIDAATRPTEPDTTALHDTEAAATLDMDAVVERLNAIVEQQNSPELFLKREKLRVQCRETLSKIVVAAGSIGSSVLLPGAAPAFFASITSLATVLRFWADQRSRDVQAEIPTKALDRSLTGELFHGLLRVDDRNEDDPRPVSPKSKTEGTGQVNLRYSPDTNSEDYTTAPLDQANKELENLKANPLDANQKETAKLALFSALQGVEDFQTLLDQGCKLSPATLLPWEVVKIRMAEMINLAHSLGILGTEDQEAPRTVSDARNLLLENLKDHENFKKWELTKSAVMAVHLRESAELKKLEAASLAAARKGMLGRLGLSFAFAAGQNFTAVMADALYAVANSPLLHGVVDVAVRAATEAEKLKLGNGVTKVMELGKYTAESAATAIHDATGMPEQIAQMFGRAVAGITKLANEWSRGTDAFLAQWAPTGGEVVGEVFSRAGKEFRKYSFENNGAWRTFLGWSANLSATFSAVLTALSVFHSSRVEDFRVSKAYRDSGVIPQRIDKVPYQISEWARSSWK